MYGNSQEITQAGKGVAVATPLPACGIATLVFYFLDAA